MKKYLSPRDVSAITGFSAQKVRQLIQAGLLPAKNTSPGRRPRYAIRECDLETFMSPDEKGAGRGAATC